MNKNKLLKIITATTMASSAIAAVAPVQTEAASSSVDKAVSKAKNQITKAFNTYYKAVKDEGTLPNASKIQKETKLARDYYNAAIKQITKSGGSKSKKATYMKQLNTKKKHLMYAENYVAAVKVNIGAEKAVFQTAVKGGTPSKVLTAKVVLDKRIAQFEGAVAKIYGQGTRKLLLKKYAEPARNLSATVDDEIAVYKAYKQIEQKNLIQTDLAKAEKLITDVEDKVAKLKEKDTSLAKNLVRAANKDFAAYAKASGFITNQKEVDAVIANAKDGDQVEIKFLALENVSIETTKSLTITLTGNVKGKDITINAPNTHVTNDVSNSGVITIKDVSNNSFEQAGTYDLLVFEDQNGGRLINGTTSPLNITLGDGAKPTLKGQFGTIKVDGSAEVILEAGTIVSKVEATGVVHVTPGEGAKVEGIEGKVDVIKTQPSSGGGGGGRPAPVYHTGKLTLHANNSAEATVTVSSGNTLTSTTLDTIAVTSGDTVDITVEDKDLDENAAIVDSVTVKVGSDDVVLTETGVNTGIFKKTTNALSANTYTVTYTDSKNASGISAVATAKINVPAPVVTYTGKLTVSATNTPANIVNVLSGNTLTSTPLDTIAVTSGDTVDIIVEDKDLDENPAIADTVTVKVGSADVELTETDVNTGIFTGTTATFSEGTFTVVYKDNADVSGNSTDATAQITVTPE